MKILLVSLLDNSAIGLRSISANLLKHEISCGLVFLNSFEVNNVNLPSDEEIDSFVDWITEMSPESIGIAIRSPFYALAKEISVRLRKRSPAIKIIWGGPHVTVERDNCLKYADFACVGEAEESLVELFQTGNEEDVPPLGIISKKHPHTKLRVVKDLCNIPHPLYDSPIVYYYKNGTAQNIDPYFEPGQESYMFECQTSRGCLYACTYCCSPLISDGSVRTYPVKNVIDELVEIRKRHKIGGLFIIDEVFGLKMDWLKEFVEAYRHSVGLPFVAQIHPLMVNERRAELYAACGMECAILGIQSGSERIRTEVYNRKGSNEELLQKIELLLRYGIAVNIDVIIDNPYETEEDLKGTFDFIVSLPREVGIKLFSLVNLPGTQLTERLFNDGYISANEIEHFSCKSFKMWRGRLDKEGREGWRQYWTTLILLSILRNHSENEPWDGVTSVNSENYHHLHRFTAEALKELAADERYRINPELLHQYAKEQIDDTTLKYLL